MESPPSFPRRRHQCLAMLFRLPSPPLPLFLGGIPCQLQDILVSHYRCRPCSYPPGFPPHLTGESLLSPSTWELSAVMASTSSATGSGSSPLSLTESSMGFDLPLWLQWDSATLVAGLHHAAFQTFVPLKILITILDSWFEQCKFDVVNKATSAC